MGYYSEVVIFCAPKAYKKISKVCDEHRFKPDEDLLNKSNGNHALHWAYLKWYDTFIEVSSVMKALRELDDTDDDDDDFAYRYIRIGEELCDVEDKFNDQGYYEFSEAGLRVEIEIEIPTAYEKGVMPKCVTTQ